MTSAPASTGDRSLGLRALRLHIIVELVAFGPPSALVLEAVDRITESVNPHSLVTLDEAAIFVLDAKLLLLELLRENGAPATRIEEFFEKDIKTILVDKPAIDAWRLFLLSFSRVGQPCESLLVDYYVRGLDRPPFPGQNQWLMRPKCKATLISGLRRANFS